MQLITFAEKREADRALVLESLKDGDLLFFPEGWDTRGDALMLYQKFLFSLEFPIQPVAMEAWCVGGLFQTSILGTSVAHELFWLFFAPMTVWRLTFLPAMQRDRNENEIQFAKRVQVATAKQLRVPATDYHYREALELRKKRLSKN